MDRVAIAQPDEYRLYLTTPYGEKDEAKALGAKWDPWVKRWWINKKRPDKQPFARWLPYEPEVAPPAINRERNTCTGCGTYIDIHIEFCAACREIHPVIRRRRRVSKADKILLPTDKTGLVTTSRDLT